MRRDSLLFVYGTLRVIAVRYGVVRATLLKSAATNAVESASALGSCLLARNLSSHQGTPTAAGVGTTSGIAIAVSDGTLSATLPSFSVTVQAVAAGSATLSWMAPTQNTDGSPLTDLAGFKIYWGTTQGAYPNSVTLTNPGLTLYVVDNLVPGTYFFVATALNTAQVESAFSVSASKTIQ